MHNLFGVSTFENCEYVFIPRLNQASFVLPCFVLFAFWGCAKCLVFAVSAYDLSSVPYFPVYM